MNYFFISQYPSYYFIYPETDECLWLAFEHCGRMFLLRNGIPSIVYQREQGITQYDREKYLELSRVFLGSKW